MGGVGGRGGEGGGDASGIMKNTKASSACSFGASSSSMKYLN